MNWRHATQRLLQPYVFYPLQNAVSLIAQSHRTKHQILSHDFTAIHEESRNLLTSFFSALGVGSGGRITEQQHNSSNPFKTRPTFSLQEVKAANAALSVKTESPCNNSAPRTAVFTGATRGLGLATLEAWAKHIPNPTAIIVGRNKQASAPPLLRRLRSINPNGTYIFLEAEASLINSIDDVCNVIHDSLSSIAGAGGGRKSIDALFMSQGFLNFSGRRQNSAEQLDTATALRYYGRLRFIHNLLPLMSSEARIISILAGGMEGKIFTEDMDMLQERNYSLLNSLGHFTTMLTLSHDAFAKQHPRKSFLHVYPGFVNTGVLARSATKSGNFTDSSAILAAFFHAVEKALGWFILQPEEVGERMLFYATSERFKRGSWSLDWDGAVKEAKALVEYRNMDDMRESVVEHNERVFEMVTSRRK